MSNRIALVFGGTRGIGAACVQTLAEQGYNVAYTYVNSAPNVPAQIGQSKTKGYAVDIRQAEQVEKVFSDVAQDFGSMPHCVVANAGINVPPGPMATFNLNNFRDLVETNIIGAFHVLQAAAKHVPDGGNIIGLTTSMVRVGVPGGGPYTATKAAVESFLRSMSKELAPRKIRVNGVAPGPVDTDLFRAGKNDEALARSAALSPFNRVGQTQEIAEVVAFLASDRASWVHGQIVQPNGGMV
jgi:3-oxoacyl-[acyl-carrier protein] reductase